MNGMLCEIEKCPELGVNFSGNTMFDPLFASDFVGIAETESALESSIDTVHVHK